MVGEVTRQVTTDENGEGLTNPMPVGEYSVTVTATGYENKTTTLVVTGDNDRLDIELTLT
jgi:hypothetical protein